MKEDVTHIRYAEMPISDINFFEVKLAISMPTRNKTVSYVQQEDSRFWNFPYLPRPDFESPDYHLLVQEYISEKSERRRLVEVIVQKMAFAIIAELEKEENREPSTPT